MAKRYFKRSGNEINSNISVDICIATFKRPQLLKELLESIKTQAFEGLEQFRIIVVDNDAAESARKIVASFKSTSNLSVIYDVEPVQNIALARNRALKHALADFAVFIDDDEFATPGWLEQLVLTAKTYEADVVFGPVLPLLPDNAPDWIVQGGFFERPRRATGAIRKHGGTGNTLLNLHAFKKSGFQFNRHFGLTGGSDTELFFKMYNAGYKLVWCDTAIVYERVPLERMRVKWIIRRAFRGGQTYARIFYSSMSLPMKILWGCKRLFYLTCSLAAFPFLWPVRRAWGVAALQKTASNFGQLQYRSANQFQEYAHNE